MTELQQNRYDQLLRRVGDLKGPGSKVNDVLQELFPTIDVENVPGELLLLMATRIGWGAIGLTPTAGKKAGIQLFNPADSGHLLIVTTFIFSSAAAGVYTYGLVNSALATNTGVARIRDGRAGLSPAGIAQLRTSVDAVSLSSGIVRIAGSTPSIITDANSVCILPPGLGLNIVGATDQNFQTTFMYRERVAEPSELNF